MRFLSFIAAFAPMALLAGSPELPAGAQATTDLAPGAWEFFQPAPGDATMTTAPISPGGPSDATTQTDIDVSRASDPFYLIQMSHDIAPAIPVGDRLKFSFWGRASDSNPVRVVIEQNHAPYTNSIAQSITLSPQWQQYVCAGDSIGFTTAEAAARIQVGGKAGDIELADIRVLDMGEDPAMIDAQTDIQPDKVQARIRKYRMGDITIRVVDSSGKPVPGARVRVQQTAHAFLFGCNIFQLNPTDTSPTQLAYQKEFTALFNYTTLPFYWSSFETQRGKPQFDRLNAMANWCVSHGITCKAHPLVWQEGYPTWWAPPTPDEVIPLLHQRVLDIVSKENPIIHYYDVVNEANSAATFSPANGESLWVRRDGAPKVVETALGWARSVPGSENDTFIYNDFDRSDTNVQMLKQMKADGVFPDAIGIQSHMHYGKWAPTDIWMTCQRFAQFGVPIHFTETTIISGGNHTPLTNDAPPATDWPTTPEGEADQAKYVPMFYSLLFSHPSVRAITWWDFTDLNAWMGAPGGLVRKDMSPKPAYNELLELVKHQWWTDQTGATASTGKYTLRAFYGNYTITVTGKTGKTVTKSIFTPEESGPHTVTIAL